MDVLLLNHYLQHFGQYSGYDCVFDHFAEGEDIHIHLNKVKRNWVGRKLLNKKLWLQYDQKKYGLYHNFEKYVEEYFAFQKAMKLKPDIIHFSFAEDSLGLFSDQYEKLPKSIKLVGTIHQPPAWWKMSGKSINTFLCLDALIVLSIEAKHYFQRYLGDKVHFIPHGVHTSFFAPALHSQKKDRNAFHCLFVGNWLRDFAFFVEVVETLNKRYSHIVFNIVYPNFPDFNHPLFRLIQFDNINWHRHISDQDLLSLYQQSDVLFLPLLNSTGNNALLEAASCCLPIITSYSGGVKDYFPEELVYATENNIEKTLDIFDYLLNTENKENIVQNSKRLGSFVNNKYDVKVIAHQIALLYKSLASER